MTKLGKLSTSILLLTTTLSSTFIASPVMANDSSTETKEVPYIFDAAVKGGNNRTFAQVGGFIPVYETDNDLVFGDVRFMRHIIGSKKKEGIRLYNKDTYEGNIGLGYRYAYSNEMIVGGAAYYDMRKANLKNTILSQATFNVHFITPVWQTDLNAYVPVGKKKVSVHTEEFSGKAKAVNHDVYFINNHILREERTANGVDLHVKATIPGYEKFSLGPVIYHFKGKKAFTGGGIEMKWDVHENVSIEADYTYDKVRKSNFMVGVRFNIASSKLSQKSQKKRLMARRVKRDVDAVTDTTTTITPVEIFQPDKIAISPDDLTKLNSNNSNDIIKNINLIDRLSRVKNSANGEVIVAGGGTFVYKDVDKIGSGKFRSEINKAKTTFSNSGKTEDQLNGESSKQKNHLKRAAESVAIQENYRTANNKKANQYRLGNKDVVDYKYDRNALIKYMHNKYITNYKQQDYSNDVVTVTLPGMGSVLVDRAGVMVITKDKNGNYVAPFGENKSGSYEWFSGGVSKTDGGSHHNAANREFFEETRGAGVVSPIVMKQLEQQGCFVYNANSKTYILVYPDVDGSYLAENLNTRSMNGLPSSFREVKSYKNIPLHKLTNAINTGNKKLDNNTRIQKLYFKTLNESKVQAINAINKTKNLLN